MDLSNNLQELIVRYTSGAIGARKFREEFVPLFVTSNSTDSEIFAFALNIESTYAEFLEELISEEEFKNRLAHLSPPYPTQQVAFGFEETTCNASQSLNAQAVVGTSAPKVASFCLAPA